MNNEHKYVLYNRDELGYMDKIAEFDDLNRAKAEYWFNQDSYGGDHFLYLETKVKILG